MISLEKLILFVVAIVAGVLLAAWLFGGEGAFSKAQEAVKETVTTIVSAINPSLGAKEVHARDIIPEQHQQEIQSFVGAVDRLRNSQKKDCVSGFSGFSEFGEQGTVIRLDQRGNSVVMTIFGSGGLQRDTELGKVFEDTYLCILTAPDFTRVPSLTIAYDAPFFGSNANRIDYGEGFVDFWDRVLFTPDNKHICFFPFSDRGFTEEDLAGKLRPSQDYIGTGRRFVEQC